MPNGHDLGDLNRSNALLLQALGEFLISIGNEKDAGRLLEALVAGDGEVFGEYVSRFRSPEAFDIPKFGICMLIREMVEIGFSHPPRPVSYWAIQLPEVGRPLEDAKKFRDYLWCTWQHPASTTTKKDGSGKLWEIVPDPSPLLDCLKQHGLVTQIIVWERISGSFKVPGRVERICI